MSRRRKFNNVSEFKKVIEQYFEEFKDVNGFKIDNCKTIVKKNINGRVVSERVSTAPFKIDNDYFKNLFALFLESFDIKKEDDFIYRVCFFFQLEEFQKSLVNSNPLEINFYCNDECESVDGLCINFLSCKNYEKKDRVPFLTIVASQNVVSIKIKDYTLRKKEYMFYADKGTILFLSYLKFFLDSLTFFVKEREENPIVFSEEDELCLDF